MNLRLAWRIGLAFVIVGILAIVALNLAPERRDLREPIPHLHAVSDPQFLRTMEGIFSGNLRGGHEIDTLLNGVEIFPAMLESIRAATDTLNFETFVYWSGEIAEEFANEMAAAARRGVEVRVLIDWAGSIPFEQRLIDIMEEAGVLVHRFRPIRWYTIDRVNNRTHRKILLVDGNIGFTGGVGIGDEWLGDARAPDEYRENHYRITGPAVAQLQAAFAENWLEATGEVLQGERFYPEQPTDGEITAQLVKSSPRGGSRSMHQMLLMSLASATQNIRIGMAYFVPDDIAIGQLVDAAERGVEIDIILPGPHISKETVRHGSRYFWGDLLAAGIRIHEFQPTMYHAKLFIVDEDWVSIGSANFDERSFRLNDEANLNIYDRDFALQQIEIFEEDLARSRLITLEEWENRPWRQKFLDWVASHLRTQL
ncbi:phosphatidylserine/phosphatidylglycerophosphate/cardiolipin synthase family protein [Chelativorans sp. ZYF759]|uniref:phospholipase D-like domain-containing protein n=1 Tax=Chelativorans sp. ZYF759 TaxID=2692213 RepID=UPI001AEDCCFA|nr:phospholipase D-like domain-containing protein [Chelativorans sp. ZYF759]